MSSTSAIQEPDRPASEKAARLTDFSDWLSPMLVKELRQGLRTKVFVIAFVLLQAVLSVVLLFSLGGGSDVTSYSFWLFSAVLIVGVMPLRGFAVLSDEMDDNTLDLLMVTRLSSLRIAFGKWSALVVQTMLLCITILPYLLMRYFVGGIDVLVELAVIYCLFLLSCVLTALTVAFSVFPSFLTRSALAMVAGYMAAKFTARLIEVSTVPETWFQLQSLLVATALAGYACWFLLEFGASRIASTAENHAWRKRLASLVIVSIVAIFADAQWRGLLLMLALIPALDAVCEPDTSRRSALPGASGKAAFARVNGWLFRSGWSSGVWFTLLIMGIAVAGDALTQSSLMVPPEVPMEIRLQWIALPAAILLPVPLLSLLGKWKPIENRLAAYAIIQVVISSLCMVILLVAHTMGQKSLALIALLWPHGLIAATLGTRYMGMVVSFPSHLVSLTAASVSGVVMLASIIASWANFRKKSSSRTRDRGQ